MLNAQRDRPIVNVATLLHSLSPIEHCSAVAGLCYNQVVRKTLTFLAFWSLLLLAPATPAAAAKANTAPYLGNDISWPQCGKNLPTGQAFGIVGVNGGTAATTNPCLASQLAWAARSTGASSQPKVQLYVNTANPGEVIAQINTWPSSNIDVTGTMTNNPYGMCTGGNDLPCSWQYGWNRAQEAVLNRFTPAAQTAGLSTTPGNYRWWLDVETQNTWQTGSFAASTRNVAALEGMASYYLSKSATVGLYSTGYQWGKITGGAVSDSSNLTGKASWLAGARNEKGARATCNDPPLTAGGTVALTQFVSGALDYDFSCR